MIINYLTFYSFGFSDTDSDDEENYIEALDEPPTKEGNLKWAERYQRRYSRKRDEDSDSDEYSSSDSSSYYENSSEGRQSVICLYFTKSFYL